MKRPALLALASLGLTACPIYVSLGYYEEVGAGTTGGPTGSGGASGSTSASTASSGGASGTGGTGCASATDGGALQCMPGTAPGSAVWSLGDGDGSWEAATAVALDSGGNAIVVGKLEGAVDFGCGTLTAPMTGTGFFVTKLDPCGACLWSQDFTSDSQVDVGSVALDASGNVFLTGGLEGSLLLGGSMLSAATNSTAFVAKLSPNGLPAWAQTFGDTSNTSAGTSIAVDTAGNLLVSGTFDLSLTFGDSTLTTDEPGSTFVLKLDPSGAPLWGKGSGDSSAGSAVAADASGNVLVAGHFASSLSFGCGAPMTNTGVPTPFVAKLDPGGACVWEKAFYGAPAGMSSLAVDALGNVVVTGAIYGNGSLDFGAGPVAPPGGGGPMFIASLDPSGAYRCGKEFGGGDVYALGVAVDDDGIFVAGYFSESVDFGGDAGPLASAGEDDVFIAGFDATCDNLWAERFGDAQSQQAWGIALAPVTSRLVVVGGFAGTIDFGCGPLVSAGASNVFVATLVR